MNNVIFVR